MFRFRRPVLRAAAALAAVSLLAGCTSFAEEAAPLPSAAPIPSDPPAPPVSFTVPPVANTEVSLDVVHAGQVSEGALKEVVFTPVVPSRNVSPVSAVLSPDRQAWELPAFSLAPLQEYRVSVRAQNGDGASASREFSFRTAPPALVQTPTVSPTEGAVVGVGHPIVVSFDHLVKDRALVERSMVVTTSQPVGPADWFWLSDTQVVYRPQGYWPANTRIDVALNLAGVRTGEQAWVLEDRLVSFQVGRSRIMKIDDATHQMQVFDGGQLVRTVPVSMGKSTKETYVTRSGTKVIMTREAERRMTSESAGIVDEAEQYDLVVKYALRLTNSGEFIHAAPWSVGSQGRRNVSHGCVNVSTEHARWLYETSMVGDPVETVGTGRQMEPYNGLGGVWNVSWEEWSAPA